MSIRFEPTKNPDNRFEFIKEDKTQEIIISGSAEHTFDLPFLYREYKIGQIVRPGYIKSGIIIYKQGSKIIIEKDIDPNTMIINEDFDNFCCTLDVKLKPSETQNFDETLLDTFVQLRLISINDELLYDTPHRIIVKAPLKIEPMVG